MGPEYWILSNNLCFLWLGARRFQNLTTTGPQFIQSLLCTFCFPINCPFDTGELRALFARLVVEGGCFFVYYLPNAENLLGVRGRNCYYHTLNGNSAVAIPNGQIRHSHKATYCRCKSLACIPVVFLATWLCLISLYVPSLRIQQLVSLRFTQTLDVEIFHWIFDHRT